MPKVYYLRSSPVILVVLSLLVLVIPARAQDLQPADPQPTIYYAGATLTLEELGAIRSETVATICVQQVSWESFERGQSYEYACFDSDDVAGADANEAQMRERVAVYEALTREDSGTLRQWDHWALYYYTGWNSLIADLGNGAPLNYANAIWSIDMYGNPNCIDLYSNPNLIGLKNRYCTRQFALITGLGGGSQSAKVR